jgi:tetratricopeptide (TPR) repeat protein
LASARRAGGSAEDKAQAIGTLELAEKAASEIKLDSGQVRAMIDIARVYSAAGQNAKALALLDKALVIAKNIKDVSINAEMTKEVYAMKRDLS